MCLLEVPEGGHSYPTRKNGSLNISRVDTGIYLLQVLWGREIVDVGDNRCKPSIFTVLPTICISPKMKVQFEVGWKHGPSFSQEVLSSISSLFCVCLVLWVGAGFVHP